MFSLRSRGASRIIRGAGWACTFAFVLLLLQSPLWSAQIPVALKALVILMFAVSAIRPDAALVALAGIVPLGYFLTTRVWQVHPFRLPEALVLAFLAGYLWRRRRDWFQPTEPADYLAIAARVFAAIVLASALVQLAVVQVWTDVSSRYAVSFVDYLFREYLTTAADIRPYANGRAFVNVAALLLEGIALMVAVRSLSTENPALSRRVTSAVVSSAGIVAVLGFYEPMKMALATNESFGQFIQSRRWATPAIPSINSAGSYFIFMVFLSLGAALSSRRFVVPGMAIAGVCLWAMWLTQTRSAIVAGLATASAAAVWAIATRLRLKPMWTIATVVLALLGIALYVVAYNPLSILAAGSERPLRFRWLFAQTAWRMILVHPIAGVGIGQYPISYQQFASPELLESYIRNDAHNQFLWMGAELGLLGLCVFLWLLATALLPAVRHMGAIRDYRMLGVVTGIAAFIITWTIGQPLSIPQIAYTFWIIVGVAAATGAGSRAQRTSIAWVQRGAFAALVLFIASVPIRAHQATSDIDLTNVRYGFFHSSRVGTRSFHWAGPEVRFFIRSTTRRINVPIAARHPDMPDGAMVHILVDGQSVRQLTLTDRVFHDVQIDAPISSRRYWRVDLYVEPIGTAVSADALRRIAIGSMTVDGHDRREP